ncbi:MAG: Fe-S cluster assembly protein SufB [Parcubacteria group bacterium Gr01-1014_30]|nr:MAG: Fe-S cluster assembly protein SufB [Parcubacteria group bacterium Gr01-1014_30]
MSKKLLEKFVKKDYELGFETRVEAETAPQGLSEETIKFIWQKKQEPPFMLDWRLKAYRYWLTMKEPTWANLAYDPIDYQKIIYYSSPKKRPGSLQDIDPEIRKTYEKLGIPLKEQEVLSGVVAVDAIFDSVSVLTTYRKKLQELGIIFCSISEATKEYPDLVKKYLGSVVPYTDNFFATLNSAVFSDGSFVYVPKGVKCPIELSSYFRMNTPQAGQFERTLIVAEEGSYVSYIEGCSAPQRFEHQLHAAVVELIAKEDAQIRYATVQNWYPGDKKGKGGVFNFVTKRGMCAGDNSKISWTQLETGSAITWKYPSCILKGENSVGEFYSLAITSNYQQADTGTKMIHLGRNTKSRIVSKSVSAMNGNNSFRGLVKVVRNADNSQSFSRCDALLIGPKCGAHTFPHFEVYNNTSRVGHEASTSRIGKDIIFYLRQRGLSEEQAVALIVSGFTREVLEKLPFEFAAEAKKLLSVTLEGSVG